MTGIRGKVGLGLATAVAALGVCAAPAFAVSATFDGVCDCGTVVAFSTDETLAPEDTDGGAIDVYVRQGTTTTLISHGGNDAVNAFFNAISADGSKVYFSTTEAQTPDDLDAGVDIYRAGVNDDTLLRMSRGSASVDDGNGGEDAIFDGIAANGDDLIWETKEDLGSDDGDGSFNDVFITFLNPDFVAVNISQSPAAGAYDAQFNAVTDGAARIIFSTDEQTDPVNDTDSDQDIYAFDTGTSMSTLVSTGTTSNGAFPADYKDFHYVGSNLDVYWETVEPLEATDGDAVTDIYRRQVDGSPMTTQVSVGTVHNTANVPAFGGIAGDGAYVVYSTLEQVEATDSDSQIDVWAYDVGSGTVSQVSTNTLMNANGPTDASFEAASPLGNLAWFTTTESLVFGSDNDPGAIDVYERDLTGIFGTTMTSVDDGGSGLANLPATFRSSSLDGTRVLFTTDERLEPLLDTDASSDLYERDASNNTNLLSIGQAPGTGNGPDDVLAVAATPDGSHVYFTTTESLTADELDDGGAIDVYERSGAVTRHISRASDPVATPAAVPVTPPLADHGATVVITPVSGTILVKLPGAKTFVPISEVKEVPVGTIIDARKGIVEIQSNRGDGTIDKANFWAGIFEVRQQVAANAPLEAKLAEKLKCGGGKRQGKKASAASGPLAHAAGSSTRQLWGQGKGAFKTRGYRGSATVRGTHWLTTDKCKGSAKSTTFKVVEGVLGIDDFAKKGAVNKVLNAPGRIKLK